MAIDRNKKRKIRQKRVRAKVIGTSLMPRLSVFRSNKHLSAQIIDDEKGHTLVSVNDAEVLEKGKKGKSDIATLIGAKIAEKAKAKKISKIVFDRSGYIYTGKIKAIAEGARAGGLEF